MEFAQCIDIRPRAQSCCGEIESGRIRAAVFVLAGLHISDYGDPLVWLTLISRKEAFVAHKIRGSYSIENVTVDGFGSDDVMKVNATHTIEYAELFNCDNEDFYEDLENSSDYRLIFITDKGMRDSGVAVKANITAPVDEINTVLTHKVTVTWTSLKPAACYAGVPPLVLRDCAYQARTLARFCPPTIPACIEQGEKIAVYGNDSYPGTPGTYELDYTFENVPSYPIVALQQTTPAQQFFDTFDVVDANGVIIASADGSRNGITGIFSLADLVAATPLSVANQSQWAVKYTTNNSYRIATWYNDGIDGGPGTTKTVKIYIRGFAQFRIRLFCAPEIFAPPPFILEETADAENVYVVSEQTKYCLCPELYVPPLASSLLLDGSPSPDFLGLDPNTTYEYQLTGNFSPADYARKICCPISVMFVFIGSGAPVIFNATNVGPVDIDGVTFTYDPLTYTITVETPADVTGININGAASVESCETQNYPIALGDCAPVQIQFLSQAVADPAGYLTANPNVNAVIAITAMGDELTYLSGYSYEWTTPQTNTITINANIFAPNDRYPNDSCCLEYDPDFINGSLIRFTIESDCAPGGVLLDISNTTDTFVNYQFTWAFGVGSSVDLIIENLLDPLENPCNLTVRVDTNTVCGITPFAELDITMVSSCSPTLDYIYPEDGSAATYLAANPGVDAVLAYSALNQLIYLGLGQYTWNSDTNNAYLRLDLTEQAGTPLACCPNYAAISAGETGAFQITSLCLTSPSIVVDFANPVAFDSNYTFVYVNGPGYFALIMVNDNAPTPNPCVAFTITPTITLCPENVSDLSGPVISVT